MNVSDQTIRWGMEHCFDRDGFATVKPEFWAKTYSRPVSDIESIMDSVRADRTTRAAPNAQDDFGGEGK